MNKANHAALNEALSARMTMSNAPQFLIRERRQLRQRSIVPAEILCTRKLFRKNLDSDDHIDCPFLFMAVKGKNYETKKKGTTMNSLPRLKKILIVPLLSLSVIFALVTAAHAQSLYVSTQTRPSHAILQHTPSGAQITYVSALSQPRGHLAAGNHFSTATAAQVRRATSLRDLRDKWWRYF